MKSIDIPLSDIIGIHPAILSLEKEIELPPLSPFPLKVISDQALLDILQLIPLKVKSSGKGYLCIGNVRPYRIASEKLDHDTVVPVVVQNRKFSIKTIQRCYLAELFVTPLMYQLSRDDGRRLYELWYKCPNSVPHPLLPAYQKEIAKALRIAPNSMTGRTKNRCL